MPAPDLIEEPLRDETPIRTPEEPGTHQPLAQEPPLDQVVMPDPTPQPENYHAAIWETPVTFPCLRCAARDLTYDEVVYHLHAAHGEAPVPTPLAAQYTPPQTPPASGEEALMMLGTVPAPSPGEVPPTSEETQGDARAGNDGTDPRDRPGAADRDESQPDVYA